jgi:hypothetical protein
MRGIVEDEEVGAWDMRVCLPMGSCDEPTETNGEHRAKTSAQNAKEKSGGAESD